MENYNAMQPEKLPNALAVLILGIVSLPLCCCWGIGAITGGIGLYLAKKDNALYAENPQGYTNYSLLKTGRILCIIGIVLSVITFITNIIFTSMFTETEILDWQQRLLEQYQ